MTGAGFGGCAVALVEAGRVGSFSETVGRLYREVSGSGTEDLCVFGK
jgi:galactokinase